MAYDTPLIVDEHPPEDPEDDPDVRISQGMADRMVDDEKEFFEDDQDQGYELHDLANSGNHPLAASSGASSSAGETSSSNGEGSGGSSVMQLDQ